MAVAYSERSVEVNGLEIYYREYGPGDRSREPLLLIMGLSGNADWWDPLLLELLSQRFHVVTFDNRGAGRSGKPSGPYSIAQMAEDAAGLMDHLGWASAHVLGMSMGGMIAQELALQYPDRVRKLVLLVTTCGGREHVQPGQEVLKMLLPEEGMNLERMAETTLKLLFPQSFIDANPVAAEEMKRAVLRAPIPTRCFLAQFNAIVTWSDFPRLKDIRQETLIITGSEDILVPPENSRILAREIPNSRLLEFPGGGHGLIGQFPREVAEEVIAFLA
ncbi:MAG: alpha/beta fold hydrolase [Actinobacteria bacterium]|nr:alpha/beta fold hydrolase [Actinomycetota bacterium]